MTRVPGVLLRSIDDPSALGALGALGPGGTAEVSVGECPGILVWEMCSGSAVSETGTAACEGAGTAAGKGAGREAAGSPTEVAGGPITEGATVCGHLARCDWLDGRLGAERVVGSTVEGGARWLLTASIPGVRGDSPVARVRSEALAGLFGSALRRWHDTLPIEGCPFDSDWPTLERRARDLLAAGSVQDQQVDEPYRRFGISRLGELLDVARPGGGLRVVAHGNPTLGHFVVGPDGQTGWLGLGRMGVALPALDLAAAARSVARELSPHLVGTFFDGYGWDRVDAPSLDAHSLILQFR